MPPPASGPARRDAQSRPTRRNLPTRTRRANTDEQRARGAGKWQDRAPRGRVAGRSAPALAQAALYDASPPTDSDQHNEAAPPPCRPSVGYVPLSAHEETRGRVRPKGDVVPRPTGSSTSRCTTDNPRPVAPRRSPRRGTHAADPNTTTRPAVRGSCRADLREIIRPGGGAAPCLVPGRRRGTGGSTAPRWPLHPRPRPPA